MHGKRDKVFVVAAVLIHTDTVTERKTYGFCPEPKINNVDGYVGVQQVPFIRQLVDKIIEINVDIPVIVGDINVFVPCTGIGEGRIDMADAGEADITILLQVH